MRERESVWEKVRETERVCERKWERQRERPTDRWNERKHNNKPGRLHFQSRVAMWLAWLKTDNVLPDACRRFWPNLPFLLCWCSYLGGLCSFRLIFCAELISKYLLDICHWNLTGKVHLMQIKDENVVTHLCMLNLLAKDVVCTWTWTLDVQFDWESRHPINFSSLSIRKGLIVFSNDWEHTMGFVLKENEL